MSVPRQKILIVNADDFGLSPGVNRGILQAHERGIVTSASVMVRWPAAVEAARAARSHPFLSLGLHVDLGEWIFREGRWEELYRVLSPEQAADPQQVGQEVHRQLAGFRELTGGDPSHLDSHQHVHRDQPAQSALSAISAELNIPLRHFTPAVRYCGDFYGQSGKGEPYPPGITVENLLHILNNLPDGCTELCCHPGSGSDYISQYKLEREVEVRVLCDPVIRRAITSRGIRIASFSQETIMTNLA